MVWYGLHTVFYNLHTIYTCMCVYIYIYININALDTSQGKDNCLQCVV